MTTVLVTHSSKHGSTAEIAQSIARILKSFNLDVTARRVENVDDVAEFDVVILGTAIYLGEWLESLVEFLEIHQDTLKNKSVWLFASGPTGDGDPVKLLEGRIIPSSVSDLVNKIQPQAIKIFKGKIDLRRLPPDERLLVKGSKVPRGDYRNWTAINNWAKEVARSIQVTAIVKKPQMTVIAVD